MFKKKLKYRYVGKVLKKIGGNYQVLKVFDLKPDQKDLKYNDEKMFPIDFTSPIQEGNVYYFFFDVDGAQIVFDEGMASPLSPEMYKRIVGDSVVAQLIQQEHRSKFDWERFFFGLTVGAVVAFFIAFFLGGVVL